MSDHPMYPGNDKLSSVSQRRRDLLKAATIMIGGAALSSSTVSLIMNSCAPPPQGEGWQPAFFSSEQIELIAEVAERIIPRTDTPGAKDAMVHRVLDEFVSLSMGETEQNQVVESIKTFDEKSQELHSKDFVDCNDVEKDAVLSAMADGQMNAEGGVGGTAQIFAQVRSAVVGAYLTSEVAAKEVLVYDPIPTEYRGCIDFTEIGGIWAI